MPKKPENRPEKAQGFSRRTFIGGAAASVAAMTALPKRAQASIPGVPARAGKFKLKYAPYFGMFENHAGKDRVDQIKFAADQGFLAMFDNGFMNRPAAEQEKLAREMDRLGLEWGPFVAYADFKVKSFVTRDPEIRAMLKKRAQTAVDTAQRAGIKWTLMVPGRFDEGLEWDYQTANVIDNLKFCAGICEPSGLVIVIEPLNAWTDHPGLFLTKIPQAYQICKAVGSPSCKIVNDIYHQQITEGNLIPNIDMAWDEIAAYHLGDNPGRKEPTTGEINYRNIFQHLSEKRFQGVLGMEHGKSQPGQAGEKALLAAYRACDNF
jgi:hydroxypyruvate isomerase